jgi:hypothetical protein
MNIGDKKAQQLVNSFKVGVSQEELMKSYGYDLDEINSGVILNDETIDGLIKGKLDTSHLVLKDVTVNGRVQKRWVNPNKNDSEHAQHGSEVSFSHRGESMKGKIGSVTKTGEYAIRGEDGKTYNKHAHQFDSPHEEQKAKDHASSTDTKKLQNFVSKDGTDPKLKKVAEEELKSRDDQNSDKKTNDKEVKEGGNKKIPENQVEKLDEEAEDDDNINAKFKTYEKFVRMTAKGMTKSTIVYGGGGVGKAQPLYSNVLTPNGMVKMGDLNIGDKVITPTGDSVEILNIFPQGLRKVCELTFIDGSKVRCDIDHLWKVYDRNIRKWVEITTSQIIDSGIKSIDKRGWGWRFGTPFIEKLHDSIDIKLDIDPYLLGFLLGDGCLTDSVKFSVGDRDKKATLEKLNTLIDDSLKISKLSGFDYSIVRKDQSKYSNQYSNNGMNNLLENIRKLGLFGLKSHEKFIPNQYFNGSINQRLKLIQGLMDSDGYVRSDGQTSFGSTSLELTKGFQRLVKSFGGFGNFKISGPKYHIDKNGDKKLGKQGYGVCFNLRNEYVPVTLPFKVERYKNKKFYQKALSIISIDYIGLEETKCISINSIDKLYITDDYVVTHNTYTAMKQLQNMKNPETGKPFVFFDEDKHQVGSDDYDVIKITGKATTAGLYKNLFQHNGKLVLFDDCDEVLKDDNSVNMFKGALDSTGDGTISNLSGRAIKGDDGNPIPQRYKFTGRAIFISNLSAKELPQPLKSRSLRVDLSMDADQTMERIKEIASHKESGKMTNIKLEDTNGKSVKYDHQDMVDAISFMDKHKNKMGDLNVRTLGSIVKLIHDSKEEGEDDDWQTSARHMVFSKGFFPSPNEISKAFNNIIQKR